MTYIYIYIYIFSIQYFSTKVLKFQFNLHVYQFLKRTTPLDQTKYLNVKSADPIESTLLIRNSRMVCPSIWLCNIQLPL